MQKVNARKFSKAEFGSRLRECRRNARYTQVDLASVVNRNRQKIIDFENGKSEPSVSIAELLSRTLGVSYDYLIFGDSDKQATTILQEHKSLVDLLERSVSGAVLKATEQSCKQIVQILVAEGVLS
ncbi:helix-turn-helix transcriptional regulator [Photobacterium kishitanii]|uniref:helix-turn-helix transcriptional regulator n=1 Tax=Photobacterium kishitanii TaxID=318456 RepID=UPI0015E6DC29|nr:helix-turn-helix transcriptional regulator [Photobacterium kishitanii]